MDYFHESHASFSEMVLVESEKILYNAFRILSIKEKHGALCLFTEETMEQKAMRIGKFNIIDIIAVVLILAIFYMLSAETLYKAGAIIMLVGMAMHAVLPPTKALATLAICMYSLGEHIQLGMKNTLSLKYARPDRGGAALGAQNAAMQIGTLAGYLVVVAVFGHLVNFVDPMYFLITVDCATVLTAKEISLVFENNRWVTSEVSETKNKDNIFLKCYSMYNRMLCIKFKL